jgi:hypothetical protein
MLTDIDKILRVDRNIHPYFYFNWPIVNNNLYPTIKIYR